MRATRCVLALLLFGPTAAAEHERMSLDQKVRTSDFIIVGTVDAVSDAPSNDGSVDIAETASKVATIRVEKVVKGELADATIKLGYATDYDEENEAFVGSIAVSPDSKRIVTGGGDGLLKVWDAATGRELLVLPGHGGMVRAVTYSRNGKLIASLGDDLFLPSDIRVWDSTTGKLVRSIRAEASARGSASNGALAFSPDGERLAWIDGRALFELTIASGDRRTLISSVGPGGAALCYTPERLLTTINDGNTIAIVNAEVGENSVDRVLPADLARAFVFNADATRAVTCGTVRGCTVWDLRSGKKATHIGSDRRDIDRLALSADGRYVVSTGHFDRSIRVWNASTGEVVHDIHAHDEPVTAIAFSPSADRVISGGRDGVLKVWNAETGEETLVIREPAGYRPGERYVLFLRKLSKPYLATTNWQYGAFRIIDGRVDDPRCPSHRLSMRLYHNTEGGPDGLEPLASFSGRLPVSDALHAISEAVALAESHVELGTLEVDSFQLSVLYKAEQDKPRVILQVPLYAGCPYSRADELSVDLLTEDRRITLKRDGAPESVAVSVDPLGVTQQLAYVSTDAVLPTDVLGVVAKVKGRETLYCLPSLTANGACPPESDGRTWGRPRQRSKALRMLFAPSGCRVCGHAPVRENRYGTIIPSSKPCERGRYENVRLAGCIVGNERWHCDMCGAEW